MSSSTIGQWTTLNPDLEIKNPEKRSEEMTAWAISGPAALERIEQEEAWEEEASLRAAAYKENQKDSNSAETQFLIDGWEEDEGIE